MNIVIVGFILAITACLVQCNAIKKEELAVQQINEKILNGDIAYQGQFPSSVFIHKLKIPSGTQYCMGTLVGENKILTHVDCIEEATTRGGRFFLGRTYTSGFDEQSEELLFHQYGPNMIKLHATENVALIRLPHPVAITNYVKPATLPSNISAAPVENTKMSTAGHGRTGTVSPNLLFGEGIVVQCSEPGEPSTFCYTLNKNSGLTVGACPVDIGSGILDDNGVLIGINMNGACNDDTVQNIAIDASTLVDWIDSIQ